MPGEQLMEAKWDSVLEGEFGDLAREAVVA
jgi:hypothetical protein